MRTGTRDPLRSLALALAFGWLAHPGAAPAAQAGLRPYPPGCALRFDGVQNHAVALASPDFVSTPITVELWLRSEWKPSAAQVQTAVLAAHDLSPHGGWGIYLRHDGRLSWHAAFGTAPDLDVDGATDVADGRWHHVAGVFDGASGMLFVDGLLDGVQTRSGSIAPAPSHALHVGADVNPPYSNFSRVRVDEVRVSSSVRYPAPFSPALAHAVDADTVAYWRFDECGGPAIEDRSGRGHTLALSGVPRPSWVAGVR